MNNHEMEALEALADVRAVLDSYAPTAKNQRGCPDGCGCTDCEMVEDLRAVLRARAADPAPEGANREPMRHGMSTRLAQRRVRDLLTHDLTY